MKNYIFNFKTFVSMLLVLFLGCTISFAASDCNHGVDLSEEEIKKDVEGTVFNNAAVLKEYESVPNLVKAGCTCSDKCVCRKKCKYGTCYVNPKEFFITGNELRKCDIAKQDKSGVSYDNYDKIYHITGNGETRYRCKLVKEFDVTGNELENYKKEKEKKKLAYNK